MSAALPSSPSLLPPALQPLARRFGPLAAIIALHVGFFYALQSGLLRQAAQVLPQEVFASFVTPEPAPKVELPKPQAPAPAPAPHPRKAAPVKAPAPTADTAAPATPAAPSAPAVPSESSAAVAPAAPPAAAPAQPKTVSGVEYIQAPQPDYPPLARRNGEQGKVLLRVLVSERGRPERVEVTQSSGSSRLDEAARQAVLRALFKPHLEDGRAIAVFAMVPIIFSL